MSINVYYRGIMDGGDGGGEPLMEPPFTSPETERIVDCYEGGEKHYERFQRLEAKLQRHIAAADEIAKGNEDSRSWVARVTKDALQLLSKESLSSGNQVLLPLSEQRTAYGIPQEYTRDIIEEIAKKDALTPIDAVMLEITAHADFSQGNFSDEHITKVFASACARQGLNITMPSLDVLRRAMTGVHNQTYRNSTSFVAEHASRMTDPEALVAHADISAWRAHESLATALDDIKYASLPEILVTKTNPDSGVLDGALLTKWRTDGIEFTALDSTSQDKIVLEKGRGKRPDKHFKQDQYMTSRQENIRVVDTDAHGNPRELIVPITIGVFTLYAPEAPRVGLNQATARKEDLLPKGRVTARDIRLDTAEKAVREKHILENSAVKNPDGTFTIVYPDTKIALIVSAEEYAKMLKLVNGGIAEFTRVGIPIPTMADIEARELNPVKDYGTYLAYDRNVFENQAVQMEGTHGAWIELQRDGKFLQFMEAEMDKWFDKELAPCKKQLNDMYVLSKNLMHHYGKDHSYPPDERGPLSDVKLRFQCEAIAFRSQINDALRLYTEMSIATGPAKEEAKKALQAHLKELYSKTLDIAKQTREALKVVPVVADVVGDAEDVAEVETPPVPVIPVVAPVEAVDTIIPVAPVLAAEKQRTGFSLNEGLNEFNIDDMLSESAPEGMRIGFVSDFLVALDSSLHNIDESKNGRGLINNAHTHILGWQKELQDTGEIPIDVREILYNLRDRFKGGSLRILKEDEKTSLAAGLFKNVNWLREERKPEKHIEDVTSELYRLANSPSNVTEELSSIVPNQIKYRGGTSYIPGDIDPYTGLKDREQAPDSGETYTWTTNQVSEGGRVTSSEIKTPPEEPAIE